MLTTTEARATTIKPTSHRGANLSGAESATATMKTTPAMTPARQPAGVSKKRYCFSTASPFRRSGHRSVLADDDHSDVVDQGTRRQAHPPHQLVSGGLGLQFADDLGDHLAPEVREQPVGADDPLAPKQANQKDAAQAQSPTASSRICRTGLSASIADLSRASASERVGR